MPRYQLSQAPSLSCCALLRQRRWIYFDSSSYTYWCFFSSELIHSWLLPPARSANGSAMIGVWDMQALTFTSASVCLLKCAAIRTKQINRQSARAGPARKIWICDRVCEQMQCPPVTIRLHFQIFSSERDMGEQKREKDPFSLLQNLHTCRLSNICRTQNVSYMLEILW